MSAQNSVFDRKNGADVILIIDNYFATNPALPGSYHYVKNYKWNTNNFSQFFATK